MNKKGFTLIELLAVIIILAIIATIVVPIVINMINTTKENSIIRSGDFYLDSVKQTIMEKSLDANVDFNPNQCTIKNDGNLTCDVGNLDIVVEGKDRPTGGVIIFDNGVVTEATIIFKDNKIVMLDNEGEFVLMDSEEELPDTIPEQKIPVCIYSDSEDDTGDSLGSIDVSDIVTCGTESFYVMYNDGKNVTMLSMYNLDVGIRSNSTGIQIDNMTDEAYSCTVQFAEDGYWYDYCNDMDTCNQSCYDWGSAYGDYSENLIYPYVEKYKQNLEKLNLVINNARLLTEAELNDLKNNYGNPSWIYSTSYWVDGVACEEVLAINSDEIKYVAYNSSSYGVRPVITISVDNIG